MKDTESLRELTLDHSGGGFPTEGQVDWMPPTEGQVNWMPPGGRRLRTVSTAPGFTLVELLVVVAIIGILAALLLPAVSGASGKAKQAQCGNNLRPIQLSLQMYADDHAGRIPPRNYGSGANWIHRLQPGFVDRKLLRCPADVGVVTNSSDLMNGFIDWFLVGCRTKSGERRKEGENGLGFG